MHKSLDNWFRVTCNASNVFNEECRGFTQCGMSAMSAVTGRAEAAVGNLTSLLDTVTTPNGMYGEMVFMDNPFWRSGKSQVRRALGKKYRDTKHGSSRAKQEKRQEKKTAQQLITASLC